MNPRSVAPRYCHTPSGASIALGGGRSPGDESARPLCSRHFQQTNTAALVSGCGEVETQAPGKGWVVSPPRAVRCRDRGPPLDKGGGWHQKPTTRTVSPPHHLPFSPGYVLLPVTTSTRGSRRGTLTTWARPGDYRHMERKSLLQPRSIVMIVLALCLHLARLRQWGNEERG